MEATYRWIAPRRRATALVALAALAATGCIDRPIAEVKPCTQSGVTAVIANNAVEDVDLLVAVDNSGSMRENQANIMAQFEPMIRQLVSPPCVSPTDATPHTCNPSDPSDRPRYRPVKSLHVGVVSSDLGTPGSSVPGCANSDLGDDGLLNPIRYGQALRQHPPFTAPAGFRPADCTDPNQFPSFITFDSTRTTEPGYVDGFVHDFRCNAGLYIGGCGLEQQLESVWRALVWHDASDTPGNTDPNAGFLRQNALLAILMLTDEEDGSVQDCRFARGEPCTDSLDVFDSASTRWSSSNLNLRFYMYQPRGEQDPTWPVDRYIDPSNPTRGFLSVKPGHPERILFAAITGVPLQVPMAGTSIDWDALLGAPGGAGPDDFAARNSMTAVNAMSREGPVSMRQANADPGCSERVVPACRREGTTYDPTACATTQQYFAWPARRVVEVARRFDQSHVCNGVACSNGIVTSICSNDFGPAVNTIVQRIQSRITARCLPRVLRQNCDAEGNNCSVDCIVREYTPAEGLAACDAARGRAAPPAGVQPVQMLNGRMMRACDINPVPTNAAGMPSPGATGWFYDTRIDPADPTCRQRVSFTDGAQPLTGTITRLECIQSVSNIAGCTAM